MNLKKLIKSVVTRDVATAVVSAAIAYGAKKATKFASKKLTKKPKGD